MVAGSTEDWPVAASLDAAGENQHLEAAELTGYLNRSAAFGAEVC